jgi:hypothetical protein
VKVQKKKSIVASLQLTVRACKKNFLADCPGGDSTRLRKLRGTVPFQSVSLKWLRPNLRKNRTVRLKIALLRASRRSQVTRPRRLTGWSKRRQRATLSPRERADTKDTSDSGPLPWGEGGEHSEPSEGSFPFNEGKTPTQLVNSVSRHSSAEVVAIRTPMPIYFAPCWRVLVSEAMRVTL